MPETDKRPLKVFLCHAHADRDVVRTLYARLTQDGVDAWLDKVKLLPGQDWEFEIRKAVRESDVVVVCLSKQFNYDGFRQKEVRLALDTAMEKPEGEIFIIPARLEECDNLESLRRWHWVNLFEDDGYEMLMHALRTRANNIGVTLHLKKNWLPNITGSHKTAPPVEKKPVQKRGKEIVKVKPEAEKRVGQNSKQGKAIRETAEKLFRSLSKHKRIIIPTTIIIFLCAVILAVFPIITKSDISSTPVSPGISDINIPSFLAGQDVYIYFNPDQIPTGQKFESRWFLKVNILWTNLYIPIGHLEYIPSSGETRLFFHLKNPGITGVYRVDIYMDQDLVGTQIFEIYPK
jgi:hypothetical protein